VCRFGCWLLPAALPLPRVASDGPREPVLGVALADGVVHLAEVVEEAEVVALEGAGCERWGIRIGRARAEDATRPAEVVFSGFDSQLRGERVVPLLGFRLVSDPANVVVEHPVECSSSTDTICQ